MGIRWDDPDVASRWQRALVIVAHTAFGLYLWEFFTTMGYEVALLQRRRKLTLGGVLYLLPRYTLSILGIVLLRMCNVFTDDVNCTRWDYILHVFAYSTNTLTQGLLYARVCALSKFNRYVTWGFGAAYLASWGMAINGMCKSEAIYIPEHYLCQPVHIHRHSMNLAYQFSFELSCVITMLFYLFRMYRGGNSSLWRFLLHQGVSYLFWLLSAFLVLVVCVIVNPGDLLELIFMIEAILVMTISGTRMQRNLVDFVDRGPSQDTMVDPSSSILPKPPIPPPRRTDAAATVISLAPGSHNNSDPKVTDDHTTAWYNELRDLRSDGKSAV